MADNTQLSTRSGDGDVIRTEDRSDIKTPVTLIDVGGTSAEALLGDAGVYMPVQSRAAIVDDAAFTAATSYVDVAGFVFDDSSPDSVNEGDAGAARMSANRCQYVMIRDAAGNERGLNVDASGNIGVASHAVTNAGTFAVQVDAALPAGGNVIGIVGAVGQNAHDSSAATNPVRVAGRARSSEYTAVANDDVADFVTSLLGKQVTLPYAIPGSTWDYAGVSGGITDTADDEAKAAGGVGVRHYVTGVQVINGHATVSTEVVIKDGSTVIWRGWAQAGGGGCAATFAKPLRGTANTAINVTNITTGSKTYFNLQGYTAAE